MAGSKADKKFSIQNARTLHNVEFQSLPKKKKMVKLKNFRGGTNNTCNSIQSI